ncbi:MAG: hypothetical protein ACO1OR_09985 [Hydrogenophaga sp.]
MNPRTVLLWGGLPATAVATWYAAGIDDTAEPDTVQAVARPARTPQVTSGVAAPAPAPDTRPTAAPITAPVARIGEPRMAAPRAPLMPVHSWLPPPAPPPAMAQVAAPPQAPALPFRYLGRLDEGDGVPAVFLAEGALARPHVVRAGDRVRDYQVLAITEQGMTFVYLPLQQKQQLLFGNPN